MESASGPELQVETGSGDGNRWHGARLEPLWDRTAGRRRTRVVGARRLCLGPSVGRWWPTVSRPGGRGSSRRRSPPYRDRVEEGRDSTGQGAG